MAAVAGRDFYVVACDTRMMGGGGYDLLERNHIRSRLWVAVGSSDSDSDSANHSNGLISPNGSIQYHKAATTNTAAAGAAGTTTISSSIPTTSHASSSTCSSSSSPPILIASAGCSADCEMLKRTVRADLKRASYFSESLSSSSSSSSLSTPGVANLLSQTLYSRRVFPFYSFCVMAGMQHTSGQGQVYGFDAIGSYEQVAVATGGTGRELLQPILDRQFQSLMLQVPGIMEKTEAYNTDAAERLLAIPSNTRRQIVPTVVSCSSDTAVSILVDAFRDVSEREIGVGDEVVVCVVQRTSEDEYETKVLSFELKKH